MPAILAQLSGAPEPRPTRGEGHTRRRTTASTVVLGDRPAVARVDALVGVVAQQPPAHRARRAYAARSCARLTATVPSGEPGDHQVAGPHAGRRTGTSSRSPSRSVGSIERPDDGRPERRPGAPTPGGETPLPRRSTRSSVAAEHIPRRSRGSPCFATFFAPTIEVSAHCDLPCGVYDPAQARIEAESIKAIIAKVADNDDPDFRTRAILIKEQRSELVKHHLWVLWTDYFKPPHFEKYPQLHTLVNEATKLAGASGTKGELDAAKADELLAKIDEIAEIFWETKKA